MIRQHLCLSRIQLELSIIFIKIILMRHFVKMIKTVIIFVIVYHRFVEYVVPIVVRLAAIKFYSMIIVYIEFVINVPIRKYILEDIYYQEKRILMILIISNSGLETFINIYEKCCSIRQNENYRNEINVIIIVIVHCLIREQMLFLCCSYCCYKPIINLRL